MLATVSQQCAPSKEICRMPWFLVQVQTSHQVDDTQQQLHKYFIIHSVDINDIDSSNMYVDGFVKFSQNKQILEGRILLASEERAVVEREMQQLTRATENQQQNGKFLLLQYSSAFKNVIYTVLPEKQIVWPTVLSPDTREVIVNDEQQQQRVATILQMESEQKLLETKYEELKKHTLKKTLDRSTAATVGQWILVQYSNSPFTVIYAILNQRDNIWFEQNLYKDIVAYFKQGQNVYQAIILQRSADIKELLKKMSNMKESCLQSFMMKENKENLTGASAVAAGDAGTAGNAVARYAFMGNRITFYGSHLNSNGLG